MRILLCDRTSGQFLKTDGMWTHDSTLARDFGSSPKAILFAEENNLAGVEVFWDFEDPEYNVRLPIAADARPMAA